MILISRTEETIYFVWQDLFVGTAEIWVGFEFEIICLIMSICYLIICDGFVFDCVKAELLSGSRETVYHFYSNSSDMNFSIILFKILALDVHICFAPFFLVE